MNMFLNIALYITLSITALAEAQSLRPSNCIGSISSFPNCDAVSNNLARCNALTDKKAIIACFCTQSYINAWVGCKGESRQCSLSTSFDSTFDSFLPQWHNTCDVYLSAPITTPSVALPTATYQQGACGAFAESCNRWSRGAATCRASVSAGPGYTSCLCSRSLLSLASACEIDGARQCQFSSADVTQLWEYKNCPGGSTLFANAAVTTSPVVVGATTRISTPSSLPSSTKFDTPIFGQTTPRSSPTIPLSITSGSTAGANPTAQVLGACAPILRVMVLLQRVPYDVLGWIL